MLLQRTADVVLAVDHDPTPLDLDSLQRRWTRTEVLARRAILLLATVLHLAQQLPVDLTAVQPVLALVLLQLDRLQLLVRPQHLEELAEGFIERLRAAGR